MFDGSRDARRTDRFVDGLLAAEGRRTPDERRAHDAPADAATDPAVRAAAEALRSGLVRVHPSFRFEEALAGRLAEVALRMRAGQPVELTTVDAAPAGTIAAFRGVAATVVDPLSARAADAPLAGGAPPAGAADAPTIPARPGAWPATAWRRLPEMAARQSKPLIVGGVGVASAAISLGAVYVAWRYSHIPVSGRMSRAARAAHDRGALAGRRRSRVVGEIVGAVS